MIIEIALFIFMILLDPFVGISLAVTVLSAASFHLSYRWIFAWACVIGLINDLGTHQWLGLSSLIFMLLSFIVYIIKEQFDISNDVVVMLVGFLGELLYRLSTQAPFQVSPLIIQGILVWLVWRGLGFRKPKGGVYLRS